MAGVPITALQFDGERKLTDQDLGPYLGDPRIVERTDVAVRVQTDEGHQVLIRYAPFLGWTIFTLPDLQIWSGVPGGVTNARLATAIETCADALRAVLGDPQTR